MATHRLKTWPKFYTPIALSLKDFELRKDDRGFHEGDTLVLQEWDPDTQHYTGRELVTEVKYVLKESDAPGFGLMEGYCILGLEAAS